MELEQITLSEVTRPIKTTMICSHLQVVINCKVKYNHAISHKPREAKWPKWGHLNLPGKGR